MQGALKACGLQTMVLTVIMSLNVTSAPWQGCAFFGQLRDTAAQFFTSSDIHDPLFAYFYQQLAHNAGVSMAFFGTESSMQGVFESMQHCPFFKKKGDKVKYCRWFSFFGRLEEFSPWWWTMAFVLSVLCSMKGIIGSIADLLERQAMHKKAMNKFPGDRKKRAHPDVSEKQGPTQSGSKGPKLMKHGGNDVEAIRRKCAGTLHTVLATLTFQLNFLLCRMLCVMVQPVRESHGQYLVRTKACNGRVKLLSEWASMSWNAVLADTAALLAKPASLVQMGFLPAGGPGVDDAELQADAELAKYTLLFACCHLGKRLLSCLSYSWSVPMKFAQLLHEDPAVVAAGLAELQQWWLTLAAAEKCAHSSPAVRDLAVRHGMAQHALASENLGHAERVFISECPWACQAGIARLFRWTGQH